MSNQKTIGENEILCMVSLLGDRSVRVRNRTATVLEGGLPGNEGFLQSCLEKEPDPLIRERLALILALGASSDPLQHWKAMKEQEAFNIRDGLAAVALLDQDRKISRVELLRRMDELSDNWQKRQRKESTAEEKVMDMMGFLYGPTGFAGNADEYYSLDNCFLHRMLESRKGIPVTLCCLAILLAEEEGLPVYGIGLPLHFIVGFFQGSKGIRFFDCFDSGKEVTSEECEQYLYSRGIFFHPQLLSPCEPELVLNRILINIKHIASRRKLNEQQQSVERILCECGISSS